MTKETRTSWRRLLALCGPCFLAQDLYKHTRVGHVAKLCLVLQTEILRGISYEDGHLNPEAARTFSERIPDVLKCCDDPIYDLPFAAEAYAFLHLVDRYRRFWDVLEEVLKARVLPVRESALDVLDIGTGPAPALYAVNDFFEDLRAFAKQTTECRKLDTPPPILRSIESSRAMVHFVHRLSEITARPGPFQPDMQKFDGFNPPKERAAAHLRMIDKLIDQWDYSEAEARLQAQLEQSSWQSAARYHICIFSNFLTRSDQVQNLSSELTHVFRALKPGGIVVIVGGTQSQYPNIYKSLDETARKASAQRIHLPNTLPCNYGSEEALHIKKLFNFVFAKLEEVISLDDLKKVLPPDLWNPTIPLKGPAAYSVRVYRAQNRPIGARFTLRRNSKQKQQA
jgi:hypothetical protein